jgi:hypothetical protein
MDKKFIFYIHTEVFNPNNFSDENFNEFAKNLHSTFEVGRQLKADVFYTLDAIQDLKDFFDNFDETNFTQSQGNRLDVLLEDFIPFESKYLFFKVHFANEATSLEPVNYPFLNAMDNVNDIKIVFTQKIINKEQLLLVHSSDNFYFYEINHFNTAKDIWKLINNHLPNRTYNFSPKHGNANIPAIPPKKSEKVSQLLSTDGEAQVLLNSAIFDSRGKKFFYNFDDSKDTFIVFPFEGETPQNQFHAFHVTKEEWRSEIPASIRKYFEK